MGKYQTYAPEKREPKWKVHPIWRGIGCLLIVIIPLMSYAAAITVRAGNEQAGWIAVPPELDQYPNLNRIERYAPALQPVFSWIEGIYILDVVLTVVFILLGFGLLTVAYSLIYALAGPPRYGPLDAPPVRRRG
jgi:hypothetical protein